MRIEARPHRAADEWLFTRQENWLGSWDEGLEAIGLGSAIEAVRAP